MYELILENAAGDQLNFAQNSAFTVTEIQGLNPPAATINTSQVALIDGAKYNSAKLNVRTINVAFAIEYEAAKNRLEVFKVLKSKQPITLTYNSQYRNVFIEGYIQSINITYAAKKQIVTCAILCPSPYFNAAQEVINELENVINGFHFPFASEGGKNLLPFPYYQSSRSDSGLTYTVNSDGSITVDGQNTASSTKAFLMRSRDNESFRLPVGSYILSGGISSTQRLVINYMTEGASTATTLAASNGIDASFTVTDEIAQYDLQVGLYSTSGAEYDDVTVYPMIRYSTYESDTYQPYGYGQLVFGYINNEIGITIENGGDVECGMIIELYAINAIQNPKIFDYITHDYFGLSFSMQAADQITIDTRKGKKSVTLLRNGVESSIFNYIMQGSTWLQLPPEGGTFVYEVGSGSAGDLVVTFKHNPLFEGV